MRRQKESDVFYYPIFRKELPFFIRMLQVGAFGKQFVAILNEKSSIR